MARHRIPSKIPKDTRPLVRKALDAGYTLIPGGKHPKLVAPDGRVICTIALSPSDWRAQKQLRAELRRNGLDV